MQTQNNISNQKKEILNLIQNTNYNIVDVYDVPKVKKAISKTDSKLYECIISNPLGCLGQDFIKLVGMSVYEQTNFQYCTIRDVWRINVGLDSYMNASVKEKAEILRYIDFKSTTTQKLEANCDFQKNETAVKEVVDQQVNHFKLYDPLLQFLKIGENSSRVQFEALDHRYIKLIYLSKDRELIDLFKKHLPIPPLHIFDAEQPSWLVDLEVEKQASLKKFMDRNGNDRDIEKKLTHMQRHIRAIHRQESEIKRISKIYFNDLTVSREMTIQAIEDANAPYRPKRCSQELSDRIFQAAAEVKLYFTVTHLLALKNLACILDDALYGRKNLINSYTNFRPAGLGICDVEDGDFNVICCGMDRIDLRCFAGWSVGLNFKLDALADTSQYNKNPTIFFKQRDFGYHFDDIQEIRLRNKGLYFSITRRPEYEKNNCVSFRIFDSDSGKHSYPLYCSSLPKYSFISNNLKSMDSILTLNFFRFLDTLKDNSGDDAEEEIRNIYKKIGSLNDQELLAFLTDVGKKMSCSAEFNFSGAYKIDLNALKSISLYSEQDKKYSVEMELLYAELSQKKVVILKQLQRHLPELFKSHRFVEHLTSKVGSL